MMAKDSARTNNTGEATVGRMLDVDDGGDESFDPRREVKVREGDEEERRGTTPSKTPYLLVSQTGGEEE